MHELPKLTFSYDSLEPFIDAATMEVHHTKHHGGYVEKLNAALKDYPGLQDKSVEELLRELQTVPQEIRTTVQNNGGGHANHSFFWKILGMDGMKEPTGKAEEVIKSSFGGFQNFQKVFKEAAMGRFGSGWAWLVEDKKGSFSVISTANQDSPWLEGMKPIMGLDVWEHAYYLKYQNRRAEYVDAWWNVVNWEAVEMNL